jgi:nitrogen-specific signal transduction histidine kinase
MLCENICQPLVERLTSQYPGQIVQIMTNFDYFQQMSLNIQRDLAEARSSRPRGGPVVLQATARFEAGKQQAEQRIFNLVNSKIDDLIDTSEYNWYDIESTKILLHC